MASTKLSASLPSLPASLRPLSPFVLRAEELLKNDPVMAYWCIYYAAQLGLDLKTHERGAQEYLSALIGSLEELKKDVGSNEAIENESVGAAYVENFALKVFSVADSEDRKGIAGRATAKKFLAAANFLELLKVFEKSNNAEMNEEKIRYAKWKASDIAKALREGRKPTPGGIDNDSGIPSNGTVETDIAAASTSMNIEDSTHVQLTAKRSPPPPPITIGPPRTPARPSRTGVPDLDGPDRTGAMSPGNWSTVATPGDTDTGVTTSMVAFASRLGAGFEDSPTRGKTDWGGPGNGLGRAGHVPGTFARENLPSTLVDAPTDVKPTDVPPALARKVHFTPSVVGGFSTTDGSPPASPTSTVSGDPTSYVKGIPFQKSAAVDVPMKSTEPALAPLPDSSPSNSSPSRTSLDGSPHSRSRVSKLGRSPPHVANAPSVKASAPPLPPAPPRHVPQAPPPSSARLDPGSPPMPPPPASSRSRVPAPHTAASPPFQDSSLLSQAPYSTYASPPHVPPHNQVPTHATSPSNLYAYPYAPPAAPVPAAPAIELTASLIAKAQKHCRFAISALEYEDAEQARKELRTALAVLGERL